MYIYLSNENETPVEMFFDDFKVEHVNGAVVQMDDYYPFGLTFNSYSRENSVDQKFKIQGQEHIDDLNLGWDSFKWRNHQPDIGRFFNIDPLADKFVHNSPYAFSENKITNHIELEGLEAVEAKTRYTDNPNGTVTATTTTTTTTTTTSKLQITVAITTGTVALDAKVGDVEVGGVIKKQETDLIGFRENEFMLGGQDRNGDYVERTGISGGVVVAAGFEGTAVNGERVTEENFVAVPFLKNSMVTDVKTGSQTLQQSSDLVGVTLGAGVIGIDAGITLK